MSFREIKDSNFLPEKFMNESITKLMENSIRPLISEPHLELFDQLTRWTKSEYRQNRYIEEHPDYVDFYICQVKVKANENETKLNVKKFKTSAKAIKTNDKESNERVLGVFYGFSLIQTLIKLLSNKEIIDDLIRDMSIDFIN